MKVKKKIHICHNVDSLSPYTFHQCWCAVGWSRTSKCQSLCCPAALLETLYECCRTSGGQRIDSCVYSQVYVFFGCYRGWILLWALTGLRAGRSGCSILIAERDSFTSAKCQTGFGAHSISYSMGAGYFRRVRRPEREGSLSTTSSAENEMSGVIQPNLSN